jgi:hypothetical protein
MQTQCSTQQLIFQGFGGKPIVADFCGGELTSDAGALLLAETDRLGGYLQRFAQCFIDYRNQDLISHPLSQLLSQRVIGLALGYEDLNDWEQLRFDPLFKLLCRRLDLEENSSAVDEVAALAGKSTLNRLELTPADATERSRYKKILYVEKSIERYFVDTFLANHREAPRQIIVDLDATDDPLHGSQEGRFFHGYYDGYCYLPLYIFCEDQLLCAKLRPANIDGSSGAKEELERIVEQIRQKWPEVKIIVRADSGFCREELMQYCETHEVYYVFGLARNSRLQQKILKAMKKARRNFFRYGGKPQRVYRELRYQTRKSWSRSRRVVAKAEYLVKGENPRFVVTNIEQLQWNAQALYEKLYCARGEMENRIKEQQLYLFADRTSTHTLRANQLRLWFSSVAYTILTALRRVGLAGTQFTNAQCHTIRLKLLKIGARIKSSTRRILISLASGYPYQQEFHTIVQNLNTGFSP